MRKLLNTLYVSTRGAYLFKDGETLAVLKEHGRSPGYAGVAVEV
jgi:hypothetical protein